MVHPELLEILCCPESHQTVREAPAELVAEVNRAIRAGTVKNREGAAVAEEIEGGLVREDGAVLYPVRNGIPIMLIGERLALPLASDAAEAEAPAEGAADGAGGSADGEGSAEKVEEQRDGDHEQVDADAGA